MNYCADKLKALIRYTDKDSNKKIFEASKYLPITTTCSEQSSGRYIYFLRTSGLISPGCAADNQYSYQATVKADSYTRENYPQHEYNVAHNVNCTFYLFRFFKGNEEVVTHTASYQYTLDTVENTRTRLLTVTDLRGIKIFETEVLNCDYQVSCDEDCPEGFCKCIIPEYPGYCCLDCASTAASIRAITNELRSRNGR